MPEIITENDAQYALDIVKAICAEVGPGLPGSSQERVRAAMIQKELESHLGAGNFLVEEFTVAPGAFVGAYPTTFAIIVINSHLTLFLDDDCGIGTKDPAKQALNAVFRFKDRLERTPITRFDVQAR